MTNPRRILRDQIIELLDRVALPDSRNRTSEKANHYTLRTASAFDLRLMLQTYENQKTGRIEPPNIWVLERATSALNLNRFDVARSPGRQLYLENGASGKKRYGRHSGLRSVPQLADADLIRITPKTFAEAEIIVAALKSYSP